MEKTKVATTVKKATTVDIVALVLLKKTKLGSVAYGSLVGSRHRKIPAEVLPKTMHELQFMHYKHYDSLRGKEELILIGTGPSGEHPLRWKRINKSLITVELPQELNIKIPPVFGGCLVGVSKTPISAEEANEGKVIILPSSFLTNP